MDQKPDRSLLRQQQAHWQSTFEKRPGMFGRAPSHPARHAAALFEKNGFRKVLELGAGQGRDTLYFAQRGFEVTALDYSSAALEELAIEAQRAGVSEAVAPLCHDVKQPLPFGNEVFDACYSHMLYCMALTYEELESLSREIRRVLKRDGLNIYSVRHTGDADYGKGPSRGEDLYESDGFVVHFFSREKVMRLSEGYEMVGLDDFEEGSLPRKLFLVTLKKSSEAGRGN